MARVTRHRLDPITVDVANETVGVHVDVTYSKSDKDANTPYTRVCTLLGDDDGGAFAEDPTDDLIPGGILTEVGAQVIRAVGLDVQTVTLHASRRTLSTPSVA